MKIVTSYLTPDLDGVACLVAYSELLESKGEEVVGAVFGEPDEEAQFILEEFVLELPNALEHLNNNEIILVDVSFPDGVSDQIELEKEENLDYAFLISIDIESGKNFFITVDQKSSKLLSSALGTNFEENLVEEDDMMLRKEVMPKIRDELE